MKPEIEEKKTYLLHWMYDFIEDDEEPAYLPMHVKECDQLLTSFINDVTNSIKSSDYSWITEQIEQLIKALNELNFKLDHQLIESDQKQDITDLIRLVVEDTGHDYQDNLSIQLHVW